MPRTSSSRAAAALALALASASSVTAAVSGSGGASISSVTDPGALQTAAAAALTNLLGYYKPNALGVYNQVQTPWHESGIIWNAFFDYQKWTGASAISGRTLMRRRRQSIRLGGHRLLGQHVARFVSGGVDPS